VIFALVFLTQFAGLKAQDVNVTSAFDTSMIYIGDQLRFTVTIDKPAGLKLTLPGLRDTLCKNIEIISGPVVDSSTSAGRVKIIQKYLVTSFDSGRYQVKPVFAQTKSENGLKRFYSDYAVLDVMRMKIAPADSTEKIYDIIRPHRAPITIGEILPWLLLAILAAFLAWIALRFIKKFKKSPEEAEVEINPDPAHVIALRELEKLREEQLWQKGELKNYYSKLTEILRQYLENRFRVFSLELTTEETLNELVRTGFRKDKSYEMLKNVLTGADLVKFAKYIPDGYENDMHFSKSWDFVMATREQEPESTETDGKNLKEEGDL
jgi:hypothetical protein